MFRSYESWVEMGRMSALVIGTAGHIDHGKTSLVRRLTGVDLDALPEEKERGITIALGFTSLDLDGGRRAAFVDVPGHERLVRTMIAGAGGLDAVLLCVSAVDGAMPQTREHLAILSLLGVRSGLVVLTMADLVDEEMLELAAEDVRDAVQGTFLEGGPVIPFSSITGRGEPELLEQVSGFSPADRPDRGAFRLPVDRAFSRQGFGTVVTGTALGGRLGDGALVHLLPSVQTARVRGIQSHGDAAETALAGRRIALNLSGVEVAQVPRGTVVSDRPIPCTPMVDVMYRHLPSAPDLRDGDPVRLLSGTAEVLGRIHLAVDSNHLSGGNEVPAQLRLESALPCLPGDRFVLRRTSPMETLGGGTILDPWAKRMRQKDRLAAGEDLRALHGGDRSILVFRGGEEGLTEAEYKERGAEGGTLLGDRWLAAPIVARLEGVLLQAISDFHLEHPLALGAHRRELRRGRLGHLGERVFDALVDGLALNRQVQVDGALLHVAGYSVRLTADQEKLQGQVAKTVNDSGIGGLPNKRLYELHAEPEVSALLRLLESEGRVRSIAGIGWVSRQSMDHLGGLLKAHFDADETLSPGGFKELTGLTRRAAIPLLEWLDGEKWTRRQGNQRTRGARL